MPSNPSGESGIGLERSCAGASGDWMQSTHAARGIECLEAWFHGAAYHPHRHDTYAICLTTSGTQAFHYRGTAEISLPGHIVVLHPDEVHDGHSGTAAGFGYRELYVEPALIFDAVQVLRGQPCALPFVRRPVVMNRTLVAAITSAFLSTHEPLTLDSLVVHLAAGLMESDPCCPPISRPQHLDVAAVKRARDFLDAEHRRVVRSAELEAVTGLTRYDLARQFRVVCGTSPYRYLLMRRLAVARKQIAQHDPLVEVALETGFADQAHLTRMFKATYGLTPTQYGALSAHTTAGRAPEMIE